MNRGFTLLEITIVLMIIGLLAAGIIAGDTLLRSSQLRAVIAEEQSYVKALGQFQDKYQALPGDFTNATVLWSNTADGDGNGHITDQTVATFAEQYRAWQHLQLADFSDKVVTAFPSTNTRVPGTNIPESQLKGAGWGLIHIPNDIASGGFTDLPYIAGDTLPGHVLWLGGPTISGNAMAGVLSPEEALSIDTKMDDSKGNSGKIIGQVDSNCFNSSTGVYAVTQTGRNCSLAFKTAY